MAQQNLDNINNFGLAFVGFAEVAASYTFLHPLVVNQTLLQTENMNPILKKEGIVFNNGFNKCWAYTGREGWRNHYRGLTAGIAWSYGFILKDKLKFQLQSKYHFPVFKDSPDNFADIFRYFVMDFTSHMCTEIFFYPLELLMTKLISDCGAVRQYSSPIDLIVKIISKEGIKGFYKAFLIKATLVFLRSIVNTF